MAKYIWQASVLEGGPLYAAVGATVTVINKVTLANADIWSDMAGASVKDNPFTVTSAGKIEFYADPGRYGIDVSHGGLSASFDNELIGPQKLTTLELTGNLTLTSAHLGLIIYTVVGTSANIEITVPASLGDGFNCSFIHRGTGTFNFIASGSTVNAQDGGTLSLPQNGRATIIECGGSNIYDLVGVVIAA